MASKIPFKQNDKRILRVRYWAEAWAWVAIIYATLYWVRPICEFLKIHSPFSLMVNIVLLFFGVLLLRSVFQRKYSQLEYVFLVLIILAYCICLKFLTIPEEKIHLIEYGILSFLFYRALRLDQKRRVALTIAFILSFIVGWVDEGIQYLLPNRYYQTKDVLLNGLSAFLALTLVYIFSKGNIKKI